MQQFLDGHAVTFHLDRMAMEVCGEFQRNVLMAEYGIPRGWVSTYGLLARRVGAPGGARAAGRALATNPFPIVIPCHRAVRSDGSVGGYQGGGRMKRALLEMEGVEFDAGGRLKLNRVYYAGWHD
jgi:methylated-DNA-[protein]-cysteine S-methyltransferase